jgi:hypothetical protein
MAMDNQASSMRLRLGKLAPPPGAPFPIAIRTCGLSMSLSIARHMTTWRCLPEIRSPMICCQKRRTACFLHSALIVAIPQRLDIADYFYTRRDDPPLVVLSQRGLMEPAQGDQFGPGMTYFYLTEAGKRVALSPTPEYAS